MNKHIQFSIESVNLIEENSLSQFATAKIQAFSSDKNEHDLICSEETLIKTAPSIYNKPILYTVDDDLDDFYTHVKPEKSLICGFVVPDSAEFIRLPDSRLSLSVTAKIWKRYAPKVMDLFKRDNGNKKVSVEMELFEIEETDNILTKMISFAYTGICILGTFVKEASPGANIQVLSFSDENKEYEKAVIKEFRFANIDMTIPEEIKDSAKRGLELRKQYNKVGTSVGLAFANYLIKNDTISEEKVRHIHSYFSTKKKQSDENIDWLLFGGNTALDWSQEIIGKMEMTMDKKEETIEEMAEEPKAEEVKMAEVEVEIEDKEEEKKEEEMAIPPALKEKIEEKKEEKKFEFPKEFNLEEMSAMFAEDEDEDVKMAKDELMKGQFADPSIVMSGMFAKMCKMAKMVEKMAEDSKVYMAENEDLKKFKADMEMAQKAFAIESTLKDLGEKVVIPAEAKEEMLAEAEKYTFAELEGWKTYCKAKSFEFAIKENGKSDVVRVGMPFSGTTQKKENDLWS